MAGPLTPYSAGFVEWLVQQGYAPEVAQVHWRRMVHLSCWLQAEKTNDTVLGLASAEEFLATQHRARRFVRLRAGSLKPLLDYLQAAGVRVTDPPRGRITAVDTLLARCADYLTTERGLAGKTIARHVLAVREFLAARQHDDRLELERLTAGEVTAFVLEQSRQRPGSVASGDGVAVVAAVPARRGPHGDRACRRGAHGHPVETGRSSQGLATPSGGRNCWPPATATPPWACAMWRS
jgi:hypothetical protein